MSSIRDRLHAEIEKADGNNLANLAAGRQATAEAIERFRRVHDAACELQQELAATPGMKFAITPESVCITLADREFWFSWDHKHGIFTGEESAHSWYDGERYATRFTWPGAEACIGAMVRACAQYFRMARAITSAPESG